MNLPDDFAPQALLAAARGADRLEDFGPSGFREPLGVLLDAYASAPLNELGRMTLRGGVVHSLRTRLRVNHWFSAHPEIAGQRITAPIVVVGMMRTGTTLVQRLLAADRRHYAANGWEIDEAAPRIGWRPAADDPRIADARTAGRSPQGGRDCSDALRTQRSSASAAARAGRPGSNSPETDGHERVDRPMGIGHR